MTKSMIEYELRSFENPDGTVAVRIKAIAMLDGKPVRHPQKDTKGDDLPEEKLRPVFAEVEVSSPQGPKAGESLEDWGLRYAQERRLKVELDREVEHQLILLGIIGRKQVVKKVKL
jgi:hypothetical protein